MEVQDTAIYRGFSGKWFARKSWGKDSIYGVGDCAEHAIEDLNKKLTSPHSKDNE